MAQKEITIQLKTGLQARPAALFVQEDNRFFRGLYYKRSFKSKCQKHYGLMSLALGKGTVITLQTEGHDEEEALETLVAYVQNEN